MSQTQNKLVTISCPKIVSKWLSATVNGVSFFVQLRDSIVDECFISFGLDEQQSLEWFFKIYGQFPLSFIFIFVFSMQLTVNNCSNNNSPKTGFEMRTSGIGSDRSANWVATTAPTYSVFGMTNLRIPIENLNVSRRQNCNETKYVMIYFIPTCLMKRRYIS